MTRSEKVARHTELVMKVANFIGWHDLDHVQGGVTADEAFAAFCEIIHLPSGTMMNVVRGAPERETPE